MPVHPLVGQSLRVVRWGHNRRNPYVEVERRGGRSLRVPLDWTDRGAPWVVPALGGSPVKLDPLGLCRLAHRVREKLDALIKLERLGTPDEHERRRPFSESVNPADDAGLGRTGGGSPSAVAGRFGVDVAQVATSDGGDGESS
jgi:hypothetical protein